MYASKEARLGMKIVLTRKPAHIAQGGLALLPLNFGFLSCGPKSVVLVMKLHDVRDHLLDVDVLWDICSIKILSLTDQL